MRPLPLLLPLILLAGCAAAPAASSHSEVPMSPPTTPPAAARLLVLGVGEAATLQDGSQLRYLRLVNDSRCPPGVQCIWAGDAEIALRWQPVRGQALEATLHTNPMPERGSTDALLGPWHLRLESLERGVAPKATLRIAPTDS